MHSCSSAFLITLGVIMSTFTRAQASDRYPVAPGWERGFEGQRKADLGNGSYLNPVLAGDRPDPSVLKQGKDYYMVHSCFESVPGLLIWHSLDLVNWEPVGPALMRYVGNIWAPDLAYHHGRFYIYFPALRENSLTNMVVYADNIRGPWSDPIDLKVEHIDPGHAVGPDGKRYVFLSGGHVAPLSDDGLQVTGPVKKVYDGWKYPEHWDVETYAQAERQDRRPATWSSWHGRKPSKALGKTRRTIPSSARERPRRNGGRAAMRPWSRGRTASSGISCTTRTKMAI